MFMDLLLEIGTEEIPANFMRGSLENLKSVTTKKFSDSNISFTEIETTGTYRRLVLIVKGIPEKQEDRETESRGPSVKVAFDADKNYTKAALGFARGQGIDAKDLIIRDDYVYAIVKEKGRLVKELLAEVLPDIVCSLTFPKTMRWGDYDLRFVRPIRWLVALFNNEVIPFEITGIKSGKTSRGHRFLSKGEFEVNSLEDYFGKMKENYVIVNHKERQNVILEQINEVAFSRSGIVDSDEELLNEITFLVEYPTALCGTFDESYLKIPPEAVITPMKAHQRYFPVKNKEGKLLPIFITVRCGNQEHLDIVRHGNERVLRARLADAEFFFEEDKKTRLDARVNGLKKIVFQEGLGTLYDKTKRLEKLVSIIGEMVSADEKSRDVAERAAHLSKADLLTNMVYEFAELQGVMGKEYAILDGENEEVAETIFEYYLPRFAGDELPQSDSGRSLSIADKIDNIVATFSRDLIPTGSQDPYALRRQAIGIVNILVNAKYNISLIKLTHASLDMLEIKDEERRIELIKAVLDFFKLRVKNLLTEENIKYDVVDAILEVGCDDVYETYLRAKAVAEAMESIDTTEFKQVITALGRTGNMAKQNKDGKTGEIKESLFEDAVENALYKTYQEVQIEVDKLIAQKDYTNVLKALEKLVEPINNFFDTVMVMSENMEVRQNRLYLLQSILNISLKIADLSKIAI
ncbi:glycine--tRNA ligase subunit beta [Selenomonadales bacterium OttesenSCG-928-I06]|nr:glycine--tRNA ligase subunit beta [Selenomonadales bacterium OttesenSCG-928-I06]